MDKVINVAVTGAAGQIGYTLLFCLGSGKIFGPQTRVALRLLEIPPVLKSLEGAVMELEDCAFPLVESIIATDDPKVAFDGINWALMVGARPRGPASGSFGRRKTTSHNSASRLPGAQTPTTGPPSCLK